MRHFSDKCGNAARSHGRQAERSAPPERSERTARGEPADSRGQAFAAAAAVVQVCASGRPIHIRAKKCACSRTASRCSSAAGKKARKKKCAYSRTANLLTSAAGKKARQHRSPLLYAIIIPYFEENDKDSAKVFPKIGNFYPSFIHFSCFLVKFFSALCDFEPF